MLCTRLSDYEKLRELSLLDTYEANKLLCKLLKISYTDDF